MNEVVLNELPENWAWTKLGDVVTKIIGGGTPSKDNPKYWKGDIPWLTVKDMRSRRPADAMDHISEKAVKESSTNIIPEDTVIIATRIGLGKVIRVPYKAAINQDLKALILPPEIEKGYLEYWFVSKTNYLESIGSGTTVKGIRLEQVRDLDFPLAPPDQQKRIVAKIEELFSHIDAGIEALKKAKQLLKQYRQSILKAAVTGELTKEWREANKDKLEPASQLLERILKERRQKWEEQQLEQFKAKGKIPKNDKWREKYKEPEMLVVVPVEELPDTWAWVAMGQIFEVNVGATPSRKKAEYWGEEINWVSSGEVAFCHIKDTKEKITSEGLNNTSTVLHPPGTVMLGMIGEGKTRGQAAILDIYAAHNQNTAAIEKCVDEQSSEYLYYYLIQQYELTRKRGSGNNQKALNKTRVQSIEFPLPPLEEQVIIAKILMEKFSAIERLENEINQQLVKAEKIKQSVLSYSFLGRISA